MVTGSGGAICSRSIPRTPSSHGPGTGTPSTVTGTPLPVATQAGRTCGSSGSGRAPTSVVCSFRRGIPRPYDSWRWATAAITRDDKRIAKGSPMPRVPRHSYWLVTSAMAGVGESFQQDPDNALTAHRDHDDIGSEAKAVVG